jgi:hypothetical protein
MANIGMGIATSHSPVLMMEPEAWLARSEVEDKNIFALHDFEGNKVSFDELLDKAPASLRDEIKLEVLQQRHQDNQAAVEKTAELVSSENPDIIIVIGDDHKEVYQEDNMPALSIYWGDTFPYIPQDVMRWRDNAGLKSELWYSQENNNYPVASDYAFRLISDLVRVGFDPAHSKYYRPEQGMSSSYGFVYQRLMPEKIYPIIPININTYYPPNQIPPERAYKLGQAIVEAVAAWPENLNVMVMATGGLSHFVVDEEFDRMFLELMAKGDMKGHARLPLEKLQSGNSEFRCWSALAGAVVGKKMTLLDYIPCYRSAAGTGCGMAFAYWE